MSNKIKMSDVFIHGCTTYNSYLVDDYTNPDNLTVIANFDMDYVEVVNAKMAEYAAHAINAHDKHVDRIAELTDALNRISNITGSRTRLPEYVQDIYHIANDALEKK